MNLIKVIILLSYITHAIALDLNIEHACSINQTEDKLVKDVMPLLRINAEINSEYKSIPPPNQNITEIKYRIEQIKKWAAVCPDDDKNPQLKGQISDYHGECSQGDVMLWSGLVCLSSYYAQDDELIKQRCQDVAKAQGENGRWWRGMSRIENQDNNSFSRDMTIGVLNYLVYMGLISENEADKEQAREQLKAWLKYIQSEKGKNRTCSKASDNRCKLMGMVSYLLQHVASEMGVVDDEIKKYKIIKNNTKMPSMKLWLLETKTTPPGYQLHLKAQTLMLLRQTNQIDDKQYLKIMDIIYKKDPNNPLYDFLRNGHSDELQAKVLEQCPAERLSRDQRSMGYHKDGDWAWQRDSKLKRYEAANGHDCIYLLQLIQAHLAGNFHIPTHQLKKRCPLGTKKIDEYNGKLVCKSIISKSTSEVQCDGINGVEHKGHCLKNQGTHYHANPIKSSCPKGYEVTSERFGEVMCTKKSETINLTQCNRSNGQFSESTETTPPAYCFEYMQGWWKKTKIKGMCPNSSPLFSGQLMYTTRAICNSIKRIKKSNCVEWKCTSPKDKNIDPLDESKCRKKERTYKFPRDGYCLVQKNGWFSKRKFW
jgi:hypothetical protein